MAESLKERQAKLAERLKTEAPKTPLQEVNPVMEAEKPALKTAQLLPRTTWCSLTWRCPNRWPRRSVRLPWMRIRKFGYCAGSYQGLFGTTKNGISITLKPTHFGGLFLFSTIHTNAYLYNVEKMMYILVVCKRSEIRLSVKRWNKRWKNKIVLEPIKRLHIYYKRMPINQKASCNQSINISCNRELKRMLLDKPK